MYQINAKSYIRLMRDLMLTPVQSEMTHNPDGTITCPGILLHFEVRTSSFNGEKSIIATRYLEVLLCRFSMAFVGVFDDTQKLQARSWDNVSNHSSCWIDAVNDEFTKVYFELSEKVNANLAPSELAHYCWPSEPKRISLTYRTIANEYKKELVGFEYVKG